MKWARRWWAGLHFNIRNRIHSLTVPYENHVSNQWSFLIGPQPLSSLVTIQQCIKKPLQRFNHILPFQHLYSPFLFFSFVFCFSHTCPIHLRQKYLYCEIKYFLIKMTLYSGLELKICG